MYQVLIEFKIVPEPSTVFTTFKTRSLSLKRNPARIYSEGLACEVIDGLEGLGDSGSLAIDDSVFYDGGKQFVEPHIKLLSDGTGIRVDGGGYLHLFIVFDSLTIKENVSIKGNGIRSFFVYTGDRGHPFS